MAHRSLGIPIGREHDQCHIHHSGEFADRPLVHLQSVLLVGIRPLVLLDAEAE